MPKKGQLFYVSEGVYSDYGVCGHFKALEDFSMREKSREYLSSDLGMEDVLLYYDHSSGKPVKLDPPRKTGERPAEPSLYGFTAHLVKSRLAEDIDINEYWGGDYSFAGFKED